MQWEHQTMKNKTKRSDWSLGHREEAWQQNALPESSKHQYHGMVTGLPKHELGLRLGKEAKAWHQTTLWGEFENWIGQEVTMPFQLFRTKEPFWSSGTSTPQPPY